MNRTVLIREPGRQASATTSARGKDTVRRTGLRDRGGQQGKGQPDRKTGPRGQPQTAPGAVRLHLEGSRPCRPISFARYLLPGTFCLAEEDKGMARGRYKDRAQGCVPCAQQREQRDHAGEPVCQPAQRTGGQGTGRSHATQQKHDKTMNKRRQ